MSKLINMERISLKNSSLVKEDMIQEFIFNDPTVLGLGDVTPIQREKIQPAGGRLDVRYIPRWKEYDIKINKLEEFIKNSELMLEIVKSSMDYYNIND